MLLIFTNKKLKNNQLDKKCRFFREKLMKWHATSNHRQMPWKGEKDPYRIWLSEIILQQTRVEQGWGYYERFVKKFPTIGALARASDQTILKTWEGLGYYSRCRNLMHTARYIAFDLKGVFPSEYDEIIQLKGVGPYTAAAIASFAFNQPHAVLDGNVFRVLSRYHGVDTPIDRPEGKKQFQHLAQLSLDVNYPGGYNQALMDFGATVCKPQSPHCSDCSLKKTCVAFSNGIVETLPVKSPPKPKRQRWFYYLVPEWEGKVPFHVRQAGDVWEGLWELPLIESDRPLDFTELIKRMKTTFPHTWPTRQNEYEWHASKQLLSHQQIHASFLKCQLLKKPIWQGSFKWMSGRQQEKLPFPKLIQSYWVATRPGV
jgi:A/G-specific adenine glycosylase